MIPKKVAVVGRGLAGLTTAHALCLAGYKVCLIGSSTELGVASYTSQGVSTIKGILFGRAPLFQAKLAGHRYLKPWLEGLEKLSGRHLKYNLSQAIEPFSSEMEYRQLRSRIYKMGWSGAFGVQVLRGPLPGSAVRYPMALRHPRDGFVEQKSLLNCLFELVVRGGSEIIAEDAVGLSHGGEDGWAVQLGSGASVQASEVVLAAGHSSAMLLSSIGCELRSRSSVGMTYEWNLSRNSEIQSYLFGKSSLVLSGSKARFGSWEIKGNSVESEGLKEANESIRTDVKARFPDIATEDNASDLVRWGLRVKGFDGYPLIGELPLGSRRIYLMTGFHKSGLQLAPMAAEMLARKIRGDVSDKSFWDAFLPSRAIRPLSA